MNSLSYLSRTLDVLAAPSAPPSTPTAEHPPKLTRVKTWSKPVEPDTPSYFLRRSLSSPPGALAALFPGPSASPPPPPPAAANVTITQTKPRRRSVSMASSVSRRPRIREQRRPLLGPLLVIRVVVMLWNNLVAAWVSARDAIVIRILRRSGFSGPRIMVTAAPLSPDAGESTDEKEDSSTDEDVVSEDKASAVAATLTSAAAHKPPIDRSVSDPTPTSPPSARPVSAPIRRTPFSQQPQKTLVLDLDETLIHSTSRPLPPSGSGLLSLIGFGASKRHSHVVEVALNGRTTLYHVYKRPFVDYFLRKVSGWYTLVIFTASMREYADPVIDWLDAGSGILDRRFFRESCTQLPDGSYSKDLSLIEQDLARVCLLDNSPVCYALNKANGIPIEGWTHDPNDEALLDLLPVLDSLRFTTDVRRILGIRGFL